MTAKHARHPDLIDKVDVTSVLNRHPDSAAKTATDYHDDQSRIVASPQRRPRSGANVTILRIGCSGWQYPHWSGTFYPKDVPRTKWLSYYARYFTTVEVNSTFYRLPCKGVLDGWRGHVPPAFLFSIKASRFLTHMKKLRDPAAPLDRLFRRARELKTQLGPVLYQLPPQFQKHSEVLKRFLSQLPQNGLHVIEFRHNSWYCDEVFSLLERHNVTICLHDMAGAALEASAIGSFRYLRLHGASAKYAGEYGSEHLLRWASWLVSDLKPGFVYFNNDIGGQAPKDALNLMRAASELVRR
jgi:uncharacterized protein YecE (DUF72 family)